MGEETLKKVRPHFSPGGGVEGGEAWLLPTLEQKEADPEPVSPALIPDKQMPPGVFLTLQR